MPRLLSQLVLLVLLAVAVAPAGAQIRQLPAPDTTAGNHFGSALALDGGRAVVGASGEDACGANSGAAYVYERAESGVFELVARLAPADCEPGRFFGRDVALSGDRAIVAAGGEAHNPHRPNTAHLFERDTEGHWQEAAVLTGAPGFTEGSFATSVALDGDRALVTTSGDTAGRRYGGGAYIYERQADGRWRQATRLAVPGTEHGVFGTMGDLDGHRLIVTASPYNDRDRGSVYVFERQEDGGWYQASRIGRVEAHTVRAALAGPLILVGHPRAGPNRSGEAALYGRNSAGAWPRLATLRSNVPYRDGAFGASVALSFGAGGPRAIAAGYTEQLGLETNIDRVVHAFAYTAEGGWVQRHVFDVGTWAFGAALALDGRTALVGRAADQKPGRAYAVELLD